MYRVSPYTVKRWIYPEMNKDELALYEDAIQGLERCIEVLYGQAMVAADEYMSFVDRVEAKATGWESRSTLQLSCTRKGKHLDLKWTGIRWFGQKNNRQSIRVRIAINEESMTYAKDRLNIFAKEWEIDEVMNTEKSFNPSDESQNTLSRPSSILVMPSVC